MPITVLNTVMMSVDEYEALKQAADKITTIAKHPMRAEVRHSVDFSGETESYLVLVSEGKSWPYMHIPEDLPDHILEVALAKLNA